MPNYYIPISKSGFKHVSCISAHLIGAQENLVQLFADLGNSYSWEDLEKEGYRIKQFKLV